MIDPEISDSGPGSASDRMLRQFSAASLMVFGCLAWANHAHHRAAPAVVFAALAVGLGPLGLLRPGAVRPVFSGWLKLTHPIASAVSNAALAALFYGVFTPIGLFFRLIGRDALSLKRRGDLETYWKPKPASRSVRSYFRQS